VTNAATAPSAALAAAPHKRPRIVLAMAYEREPTGPAFQSFVQTMQNSGYHEIVPYLVGSTVIHLARNEMVNFVRNDPTLDGLVMVDSDQVWGPRVVERLHRWGVPCVAPVIVQRNGPAIPVAYRHLGLDDTKHHRYAPLSFEIGAYMSQFRDERFDGPTCILPAEPDHPPQMLDLPPNVREGLRSPLLEVDAVGTGMVYLDGAALRALEPNPETGLFFDFQHGGEDFAFMRRLKAAGFPVMVDRGCYVGHLVNYSRGPDDLMQELLRQEQERREEEAKQAALPPATQLAETLKARTTPAVRPPWADMRLPAAVGA